MGALPFCPNGGLSSKYHHIGGEDSSPMIVEDINIQFIANLNQVTKFIYWFYVCIRVKYDD
jgi:hypothetical protein